MTTRAEVEKAIDSVGHRDGVIVVESGGKLLAARDHLEGGGCVVLVMPPQPPQAATRPEAPDQRGNLPTSEQTPVERPS